MMPLYDYAYIFNYCKLFGTNPEHVRAIIQEANENLDKLLTGQEHYYDQKANLIFIKGTCYAILHEIDQAIDCYEKVLELESRVDYNKHLAPQACYELGNIYRGKGDYRSSISPLTLLSFRYPTGQQKYAEAKKWLKRSLKYKDYETHMAVSFRAEIALSKIRNACQ